MPDLKTLLRSAKTAGFTATRSKRGHWIFRDPDGRKVATASSTPSDTRSHKNAAARLRAAGVPVPHKGGRTNERKPA